jgi:hypothetical protein
MSALLVFGSDEPEAGLPGAMPDIGDFYQVVGNNPINDSVSVSSGQKRAVALKGLEHGWSHLGEITQEIKLGNDLVLNRNRKGFQIFLGPWKEFNLSWHA